MEFKGYTFGQGSIGWLIALVVLIVCIILWFIGHPLTQNETLGMLAALAISRLL